MVGEYESSTTFVPDIVTTSAAPSVSIDPIFEIRDERVFEILSVAPEATSLLDQIAARIPTYFPEAAAVAIVSQADPDDGSLSWFVSIQTPLSGHEATAQLRRFDHEWWLDAAAGVDPEFIVTIELI